ncbi:MAG: hypothetical protein ACE5K4_10945 [Candidatus Hydrothermarchaeota archaeon]
MDDKELAVRLFKNLTENENLDITDWSNVRDWFMFKCLDLIRESDKKKVEEWVKLFEKFEAQVTTYRRPLLSNGFHRQFYSGFFFLIAQLLSVEHGIGTIEGDLISRKNFEESFQKTLKKLI